MYEVRFVAPRDAFLFGANTFTARRKYGGGCHHRHRRIVQRYGYARACIKIGNNSVEFFYVKDIIHTSIIIQKVEKVNYFPNPWENNAIISRFGNKKPYSLINVQAKKEGRYEFAMQQAIIASANWGAQWCVFHLR